MVVHDDTSPIIFAPAGTLQGSQDATNGEFVAGWAWNSAHPGTPLHVEVYDGDTLLTTVEANCFRPDLRDAGIGNGYHAFVCGLTGYIRDRRQHIITVRVAGTRVCLPDFRTGGVPVAITRQDRPTTPPIPHFSLSPTAQWFYFTFLQTLLRPFPRPVWRLPAILLATINTVIDRDGRKLTHALLAALGKPTTGVAQWQLHWKRCYQAQTDLLLSVQARRITRQWALTHIHCRSPLPTDGAILVSIHHSGSLRGMVALSARLHPIGVITDNPRFSDTVSVMDSTMRRQLRATEAMRELVYGERIFKIRHAGRSGLKLLRNCGYLVILADSFWDDAPMHPLL